MNTAFVLDLSSRGIRVLSGHEQPWQVLGEMSLGDPGLCDRLRDLRQAGNGQAASEPAATILIPPGEIRYATLDAADADGARDARLRAAVASMAQEDLAWDWTVAPDGRLRVAAVPRRVLREAQRFALAHGFHPARFSARTEADAFPGWPDFGRPEAALPQEPGSATGPIAGGAPDGSPPAIAPDPFPPDASPGVAGDRPEDANVDASRGAAPGRGPERTARPRIGPAARGLHGRPGGGRPMAGPALRTGAAGERPPIRPDSGEVSGQARAADAPEPRPRASARGAGAVGIVLALLVAAGVWAALLGPFGAGREAGTDRVALQTGSPEPASTVPGPGASEVDREAQDAARSAPLPALLPSVIDANAIDRRAPVGPEVIALPVTFAGAAQLPVPAGAPAATTGESGPPGAIPVTNGRPGVVPPARPASSSAPGETVPQSTDGSPSSIPPVGPGAAEAPAAAAPLAVAPLAGTNETAEGASAPTIPRPANTAAPRPRPAMERPGDMASDAIESAVRSAVRNTSTLVVLRPRARPDGADPDHAGTSSADEALGADVATALAAIPPDAVETGPDAVARSLRPGSRPRGLGGAEPPAESLRVASADPAPAPPVTSGPSASDATDGDMLRLDRMNLIGVYGSQSDRRALVRLPNGRFVKVRVGDRVDGGRVSAIGSEDLQYIKGGRAVSLSMPRG